MSIRERSDELLAAGAPQFKLEALLVASMPVLTKQQESQRADHPAVAAWTGRASFALAARAGHPNNRAKALDDLE